MSGSESISSRRWAWGLCWAPWSSGALERFSYDTGLQAGGVVCPRCRWMGTEGERCPVDGGAVQARKSILEDAVQAALGQSAEVLALRERPELGPLGGIAATLRF